MTPQEQTLVAIGVFVAFCPGRSLSSVMRSVPHHYSTDHVAVQSLSRLMLRSGLPGVRHERRKGGGWALFPKNPRGATTT